MWLRQPTQDLAPRDTHTLTRRRDQALVEVADQNFFKDIPRAVGPEQVLDVGRVENLERFFQQLHYFHPQYIQVAEGQPLEVIAQIQAGAAHNGDRAEAG